MKNFILSLSSYFVGAVLLCILIVGLFGTYVYNTEDPAQPIVIDLVHTIFFTSFWLTALYSFYLWVCGFFKIKMGVERLRVNGIKFGDIPEAKEVFLKPMHYSILAAVLYVIQSYIYSYTFSY